MQVQRIIGNCVIVMTENLYFNFVVSSLGNDLLNNELVDKEKLNDVINFHQAQRWIPTNEINNSLQKQNAQIWNGNFGSKGINNYFNTDIVKLNRKLIPSNKRGNLNKHGDISFDELSFLLVRSFGKDKIHLKLQEIQSIIPLLIIFEKGAIHNVLPGCYLIDGKEAKLTKLKDWGEEDIQKAFRECTNNVSPISKYAIAYAIDLRRSIVENGKRGYRHSLIEIGSMVQTFKESTEKLEKSKRIFNLTFTEFSDNAITQLCGLDVRLSPVTLIQWFGVGGE